MTWLERIIIAFESIGDENVKYKTLYDHFLKYDSKNLPKSWKKIIQRTIQDHSSDSKGYANRLDVFSSVNGLGSGTWKLNSKLTQITPIASDLGKAEDIQPAARIKTEVFRIIRDTRLSKLLKGLYEHKCQICGKRIEYANFIYSEAHHIKPLGEPHNGPDSFDNLIILCPNHHAEFDYGLIGIKEDMTVIHKNPQNDFTGTAIKHIKEHTINPLFLRYHMEEIYSKRV